MAKKETTKIQSEGRDNTRIVKRNWLKISIITFVVVAILVGLSVGMYFLFRPKFSLNTENIVTNKKLTDISSEIRSADGTNRAILFYEEDETTNWLMWDDSEGEKGEYANEGPLTQVINSSDRTYYAVNISDYDSSNDMLVDLFVDSPDEEGAQFYEEFSGLENPVVFEGGKEYYNYYKDWTAGTYEIDFASKWSETYTFEVTTILNSDDEYESTVNLIGGTTPTITSGTVMYFDGVNGYLENVITGAYTIPDHEGADYENEVGNMYEWFNYFDNFNN